MPSFDLHARYVLLTYPQCGELEPERVGNLIDGIAGAKCVIGRENHADGGIHLHCFVDFGRKRRFRNARAFDVEGHHPNVSPSKGTPEKGWDYATKDGDTVWATLDRPGESGGGRVSNVEKWSQITGASDRESFWSLVHELDPKSAACNFRQLQAYCDWKYAPPKREYKTPVGISFIGGELDGRDEWVRQSGVGLGEPLLGMLFQWAGRTKTLLPACAVLINRSSRSGGAPRAPLPRVASDVCCGVLTNLYR